MGKRVTLAEYDHPLDEQGYSLGIGLMEFSDGTQDARAEPTGDHHPGWDEAKAAILAARPRAEMMLDGLFWNIHQARRYEVSPD